MLGAESSFNQDSFSNASSFSRKQVSEDVDSVLNFVGLSQYAFLFLIAVEQFQVTVGCSRSCDVFFLHIE